MLDAEVSHTEPAISWKQKNKYTIFPPFLPYLIWTAIVSKLSNLLLKFEAAEYFWLCFEIRHSTSKWGCVMISEICFPFCTSYIIPGFGPISILVDIGEVRGSVYFSNWAIQNNFFSNAEALRRLHSHKFSVSQTPDRTGNLWGVPGSPGRVCLWAQDSQSCAEEVFASHLFASCWIWTWLRMSRKSGD